jgi:DNA-binding transcriptional regulator/RsmH inhibitor MraZ
MAEAEAVEPPRSMFPGKLDERGRIKVPVEVQRYLASRPEKKLFVTSLDRKVGQIYPMDIWRHNEEFFASYKEDPEAMQAIAFNAADLGGETEMDTQGRIVFPAEMRRELGIEGQPVRIFAYKGRIEVLSEKIYEERRREASVKASEQQRKLEAAGLQ